MSQPREPAPLRLRRRSCKIGCPGAAHKLPICALGLACTVLALFAAVPVSRASQVEKFPEGTIVKIEFEGTTIPADKIKAKLLSRVGHPLSHEKAEADLKTLLGTKWFSNANLLGRRIAARER